MSDLKMGPVETRFAEIIWDREPVGSTELVRLAEEALEAVGELTGRTAREEIVGAVFSRFCVGK